MNLQMSKIKLSQGSISCNLTLTSQVPEPYPPFTNPASDLEPMVISQMRLETHNRRRSIIVCVLAPLHRMTAVMAIVDDVEDTAVLLQLYHQPPEDVVPAATIINPGGMSLLKEPYLKKATSDGTYSLRIDYVSDIPT